jgi:hypothetical protein
MATYNLSAADLVTLLQTTVTQPTDGLILGTLIHNGEYPGPISSLVGVQTDLYNSSTSSIIPTGTQLELLTLPTSTGDSMAAASAPTPVVGPTTPVYNFSFLSPGGVVIAAGDQADIVADYNTGTKSDTLLGGGGNEYLSSVVGNNSLVAGTGANTLHGGFGNDTLVGGGDSKLVAGDGNNVLIGGTIAGATDTLVGGIGNDKLSVTEGNNRLVAGTGGNTLYAGSGLDSLIGATNASLVGGSGDTRVVARGGSETIAAGSGQDTLISNVSSGKLDVSLGSGFTTYRDNGGSTASITGGSGAAYVKLAATGNDSITGGTGAINISSENTAVGLMTSTSGNTHVLTFANGQVLTINDANSDITIHFTGAGGGSTPV